LTDWYRDETARIDDVLERGDQGRYGLCLACHEPIEAEHMRFCAETELCFGCQQNRERLGIG
jgi:RNA polymerase-binding transcription factor DksA